MYNILFTRFISQILLIIVNIEPFLRVEKIYNRFKDWYNERNSREHENNIQDSLNPFSKIELVKSKPTKAKRESCSNIFVSHISNSYQIKLFLRIPINIRVTQYFSNISKSINKHFIIHSIFSTKLDFFHNLFICHWTTYKKQKWR